ncbi:MAG: hypothetical protein J6L86_08775 [Alphaproteobacteria bacterium]|nr:hypothetical protein [Alphaproteobacteria bacterium]
MKTGLLLSAAEVVVGVAVGGMVVGAADAWAACIPTNDCAALGYKYSAADCGGEGLACPFDTTRYNCANPCTYTTTKSTCDSQCKNTSGSSCVRNGTTYYSGCGSSKCSNGQTCNNGTCRSPAPTSGLCCDDTGSYCGNYSYCKSNYSYPDCSDMISSCSSSGGTPVFQYCYNGGNYGYDFYATFACQ